MTTVPSVTPDAISALSAHELRRSISRRWGLRLSVVVGWAAFVGVWYLISRVFFDPRELPEPHTVAVEAGRVLTELDFGSNLQASITKMIVGFLLALLVSTGLGILMAYSAWWRNVLRSALLFIVSTPTVSFAVLALILLGVSSAGPILATMLVTTPFITMNVAQGITGADRRLIVMSEAFGRSRRQIVTGVLLPSSVLSVLGGIRLAFAVAWRMELLTEIFAASEGVGFEIRRSFESYDVKAMLAWTVLFVGIMLLVEALVFRQIERRLLRWREIEAGVAL